MDAAEIRQSVARVIRQVREQGDEALLELTRQWDGVALSAAELRVPQEALDAPVEDSPFARAFERAADRIRRFHERVRPESRTVEDEEGVILGMRWTAVRSVGLYVPGGKASYPSTLAMTALPAQVAGVERIAVVSPPGPGGEVAPEVLLAARVLGLREVYRVGGAQAVAALALGTATIPRVDKIFGPGNAFVAEAKQQLFGEVGIDLVAGPSEVVVRADETASPDWVAADLMAQAEHDEAARVTLLASSEAVLRSIREALEARVRDEPRRAVIEKALERFGTFEVVSDPLEAARRVDEIAPEHLSIQVARPWEFLTLVHHAGAIYIGRQSAVALGDYYLGPNHVLPTGTTARFASCLSVEDFMKRSNLASVSARFLRRWGEDVETLARGEGLAAHATSVRLRRLGLEAVRPRPGVRAVTPYALVEETAEVKLNQNESPWDIPEEIKDEVARRLRDLPWNRYHQEIPSRFLEGIARREGHRPDGVIAASGSNLILQWIFEAYGGPGRPVLYATPAFALYPLWARVTETPALTVPLTRDLAWDAGRIVARVREAAPRLVLLCLPNNPTGSEMDIADVRSVAEEAAGVGALLVVDEAYREFSSPGNDRASLLGELDNVVLVRTFSKAYAAAGMRLGYLLAPPAVAEALGKIVPPFHLGLFTAVLGEVLSERRELFAERNRKLVAERDRMMAEVGALPGCRVFPSEANFFMFRVEGADEVYEKLKAAGVLVRRPGADPLTRDCLRVNAGTPPENDRFIAVLRALLTGRGGKS